MRHLLLLPLLMLSALATAPAADVKIAVTDLTGLEELQREFGKFVEVLSSRSGHRISFFPVNNRLAAAEALRFKQVDFVLTGPAEYVVMRKRTPGIQPVVGFVRPDYCASIVVLASSGITDVKQLKGKKVAFAEIGSTSGHLAPMQLFKDYGVDPIKDIEPLHLKRKVAFEAFKRGDVAAWGENYGKFLGVRAKEAEAGGLQAGAFRVIARGPDLPNDVLIAGEHVDPALITSMRQVFTSHAAELIAAILVGQENQKYQGMTFIPAPSEAEFDYVRAMYGTAGYPEFADFIGN